jgi:uncharacterized protein with HEPN domain
MNVREYGDFLQDILGSIDCIEDFLTGCEADDFINDKRTVFAVLWCLHVLGEAAKHIPKQVRDLYPEIPWEDMTGMRDKVVHGYFGINLALAGGHLLRAGLKSDAHDFLQAPELDADGIYIHQCSYI